jgi:hypothetical protein
VIKLDITPQKNVPQHKTFQQKHTMYQLNLISYDVETHVMLESQIQKLFLLEGFSNN